MPLCADTFPELSIREMYDDFKGRYPDHCDERISFVKLGEEECEVCLTHEEHMKTQHNEEDEEGNTCGEYQVVSVHKTNAARSREMYKNENAKETNIGDTYFSADMQKVIMLYLV